MYSKQIIIKLAIKMVKCFTYVVPDIFLLNFKQKKAKEKSLAFVRMTGIEPAHREALDPKSNVSTSSTTSAFQNFYGLFLA